MSHRCCLSRLDCRAFQGACTVYVCGYIYIYTHKREKGLESGNPSNPRTYLLRADARTCSRVEEYTYRRRHALILARSRLLAPLSIEWRKFAATGLISGFLCTAPIRSSFRKKNDESLAVNPPCLPRMWGIVTVALNAKCLKQLKLHNAIIKCLT